MSKIVLTENQLKYIIDQTLLEYSGRPTRASNFNPDPPSVGSDNDINKDETPLEQTDDESVWREPEQEIHSDKTSRNQIAATFKRVQWVNGTVNADIGGGKYDLATEFLKTKGVLNLIYDPYTRSAEHNAAVIKQLKQRKADTATVNNVLNVIKEPNARELVIKQAYGAIKPDGIAYFLIYAGDHSEMGKITTDGWQENQPPKFYMPEIQKYFPSIKLSGNLIAAKKS